MQKSYCCRINRELLELDCLEMEEVLEFLVDNFAVSGKVTLVNDGDKRITCEVDREDNIIQARGLGRFFRNLKKDSIYIRPEEGVFYISDDNSCKPLFRVDNTADSRIYFNEETGETKLPGKFTGKKIEGLDKYFLHQEGLRFAISPGFDTLLSLNVVRNVEPYEYQLKTVRHVLQYMRGRALLCDEVGLGKTIEAGLVMMEYIMRGLVKKVLILTPSTLVEQWQEEMRSKFNLDFVTGDSPEFKKSSNGWKNFERVIESIDRAKRQGAMERVCSQEYDLVIVDEAHRLKNKKTKSWELINRIKKKYILLLTATPVENSLEELFNLITLLSPGQLDTVKNFRKRFISGSDRLKPRNTDLLKNLLKDVMIRNRRSETNSILTRRYAEIIEVELSPPEKDLYRDVTSLVRTSFDIKNKGTNRLVLKTLQREVGSSSRAAVPTLKKMAANEDNPPELRRLFKDTAEKAEEIQENSKALALLDLLSRIKDKVIVFTGFQQTRAYLVDFLGQRGIDTVTFHGSMRRKEKEEAIKEFAKSARVLVSTESGGEGRNLQFCNVLINYDLPWNPMRIEQRIGRIHRVGQKRDVYIYNLSAKDTIEARILELLDATSILKSYGAVVEQTEYAVVEVLLTDKLMKFFGKNHLLLAFDYEVARETPGSEFITFGSHLLDKVVELALSIGRVTECYIPVGNLQPPANLEEEFANTIDFEKCRNPSLKEWYPLEYIYYRFNFRCIYQYDEKQEEIQPVLIDMHSGRQDAEVQDLLSELEKIVALEDKQHILPEAPVIPVDEAYFRACMAVKTQVGKVIDRIEESQKPLMEKELAKVTRYYENTARDLQRRLSNTQDAKRVEHLKKQIEATEADKRLRQQDIKEKFAVKAGVSLDSIVIYHVPKIIAVFEIQQRNDIFPFEAVFNPVSRRLETPLCPSCCLPATSLVRTNGILHCGCQ